MKLYLDTKNRRFVKSAASNVALTTLVLKRRDQVPVELVFVENGTAITPPSGTTASIGLKARFADSNFLAFAAPAHNCLICSPSRSRPRSFPTPPASPPSSKSSGAPAPPPSAPPPSRSNSKTPSSPATKAPPPSSPMAKPPKPKPKPASPTKSG
jgi:hypothetical protein